VLPPTLADKRDETDKIMWDLFGRQDVVRLEGRILTILDIAGFDAFPGDRAADAGAGAAPAVAPPPPVATLDRPNRAQRRAEQRRQRARELRAQGQTIKEIAHALGCSERTVFGYLQDAE
jgi:hypothetical protein